MAKHTGFEVLGLKPACVEFPDGRSVSFPPGTRFEAQLDFPCIRRLLKVKAIRQLNAFERVPELPEKIGAPKDVRNIIEARRRADKMKKERVLKQRTESFSKPEKPIVDLGALHAPKSKSRSIEN